MRNFWIYNLEEEWEQVSTFMHLPRGGRFLGVLELNEPFQYELSEASPCQTHTTFASSSYVGMVVCGCPMSLPRAWGWLIATSAAPSYS